MLFRSCQYEGGYTDYMEALAGENGGTGAGLGSGSGKGAKAAGASEAGSKKKAAWDKGEKKLKFTYKEQKEFETIEDDIAVLEAKIEELDGEMAAHASQYSRLTELTKEKKETQSLLDEKMERWMYLTELKEKIDAQ